MTYKNIFFVCWVIGLFAGMDSTIFSVVLGSMVHDLNAPLLGSYGMSGFLLGWMVGGIAIGILSDRVGRVKALALSLVAMSLFTGGAAFATQFHQVVLCRFLTGIGVGGAMVNIVLLVAESWPAKTKPIAIASLLTSYQAGVFLAGAVSYWPWTQGFKAGFLPLLLLPFVLRIAERPQRRESIVIEDKGVLLKGILLFGALLIGYWASASWIPTWIQQLPEALAKERSTSVLFHGIAATLGCGLAGYCALRWGAMNALIALFALAFLTTVSLVLGHASFTPLVHVHYAVLGLVLGLLQGVMYIYLPELFPAAVRGRAFGLCLNCGRVVTAIAVLFVASLVEWFGSLKLSIAIFSSIYLLGMSLSLAQKRRP